MNQDFIDILQSLINEKGKDIFDAPNFKALLADYTKSEFNKESRLLLQALEAKIHKSFDKSLETDINKMMQMRVLQREYGIADDNAEDLIDTIFFIFYGIQSKKLKSVLNNPSVKQDNPYENIFEAAKEGTVDDIKYFLEKKVIILMMKIVMVILYCIVLQCVTQILMF